MEGTFIEVQGWGDFDIQVSKGIFYSEETRDVKAIQRAFCEINGLPSNGRGLPSNMISDATNEFIKYLKKEGFRQIKTKPIYFCD